jgi:hypothetical protein
VAITYPRADARGCAEEAAMRTDQIVEVIEVEPVWTTARPPEAAADPDPRPTPRPPAVAVGSPAASGRSGPDAPPVRQP